MRDEKRPVGLPLAGMPRRGGPFDSAQPDPCRDRVAAEVTRLDLRHSLPFSLVTSAATSGCIVTAQGGKRGPYSVHHGRLAVLCLIALCVTNISSAASAYDEIMAPIFRARCAECHGEQKQKAKLSLHTWEGLTRGSDAGPVLVPGKPDKSVLLERLRLPLADEDHMPPQDRPQPAAEEIALLAHWIEQGASQSATLAELRLPEALAKVAEQLPPKLAAIEQAQAQAEPLWEFDAAAVAKLRSPLAAKVTELQPRFPGALSYESRTSAALHFTAVGLGRAFGDAELARLTALREQLVALDLSGTAITDASAAVLAGFVKLRVLRAGFTEVGDATAQAAAALPGLELLALPETRVTPASISALTRLRTLRTLRVAGTAAERAAQAANLPVVASAADLLPPIAEEPPEPKTP